MWLFDYGYKENAYTKTKLVPVETIMIHIFIMKLRKVITKARINSAINAVQNFFPKISNRRFIFISYR